MKSNHIFLPYLFGGSIKHLWQLTDCCDGGLTNTGVKQRALNHLPESGSQLLHRKRLSSVCRVKNKIHTT